LLLAYHLCLALQMVLSRLGFQESLRDLLLLVVPIVLEYQHYLVGLGVQLLLFHPLALVFLVHHVAHSHPLVLLDLRDRLVHLVQKDQLDRMHLAYSKNNLFYF
jgi:hypothetical protein